MWNMYETDKPTKTNPITFRMAWTEWNNEEQKPFHSHS